MPSNIEIKARAEDLVALEERAKRFADGPGEEGSAQVIQQEDVFFHCDRGRLKLRILGDDLGELIWYDRPDCQEAKRSDYMISRTTEPATLRETLARAYGELMVVRKTRTLYLIRQTRVHLDQVEGLGDFVELEVVLEDNQSDADGQRIAAEIMQKLRIEPASLIDCAYADLLLGK